MNIKKIFSVAAVLTAITAGICCVSADEVDYHSLPHETKYSNVALYKTVTASPDFTQEMYAYPMFSLDKMVDGNINTCALGTIPQNGWIQVDLEKRYKVKKITLTDRYDTDQGGVRTNTKILASNDENFSTFDVIDSIGATEEGFTYRGMWEIDLDGQKDYRYIRIHRDSNAYGGYGEIGVYADFEVTEVSKNKPATANSWYNDGTVSCPPEMALDDIETNMNGWFCFIDVIGSQYNYLQVDLETPMNIGFIKMTPRHDDSAGSQNIYQAFDFYGSHDPIDTEEEKAFVTSPGVPAGVRYLTEEDGYYTLARVSTADRYVNGFNSSDFPMNYDKNFEQAVSDKNAYRYITYAHTYQLNSQIGTLSLYVINPEVYDINTNGADFSISFSDEMDFSDIENNIEIVDSDGNTYQIKDIITDDYTVSFSGDNLPLGETLTLNVKKEIKNKKGVPLTKDVVKNFDTPPAIEISDFYFIDENKLKTENIGNLSKVGATVTLKNNTADKEENAVLFTPLYDKNDVLIGSQQLSIVISPGPQMTYDTFIDIPADKDEVKIKAFLWKNFKTMYSWDRYDKN